MPDISTTGLSPLAVWHRLYQQESGLWGVPLPVGLPVGYLHWHNAVLSFLPLGWSSDR